MAKRNLKIPWDEIKAEYELGATIAFLCKKYSISENTFRSRARRYNWAIAPDKIITLSDFKNNCTKIASTIAQEPNETKKEAFVNEVTQILENVDLIKTNREIIRAFQFKIIDGLKNGKFEDAKDIKQGTSAIRDIENIVNPQAKVNLELNNNLQQNQVKIDKKLIIETLEDFEDEY